MSATRKKVRKTGGTSGNLTELKRDELKVERRRGVLVAVLPPERAAEKERALDELEGLAETAGVKVVGKLVQVRERPDAATYIGRGKLDELRQLVRSTGAELVVFDNDLSPAQGRNLERELDTVIVDRSEVILDIFATRAQTYEAKLQVELAQLLYFRPRLKRLWTHLERIEGGIGTGRGPGEKQLEMDRRMLDKRVAELRRKLKQVEKRRERMVASRTDALTVSLVGYTNAGKSTLMRALTGSDVYVADKLFATLDTRTRRWHIPKLGDVLLSDTVGFVRNFPHHLVASFKSTLEEAKHADLLLHVVDASSPDAPEQIETVHRVLEEIGVNHDNMILVLNKVDVVQDYSVLDVLLAQNDNAVAVSAVQGRGLDRLTDMVVERLSEGYVEATVETDASNGRLLAFLRQCSDVSQTECYDSRVTVHCRLPRRFVARVAREPNTTLVVHDQPAVPGTRSG